jgi:hypothetical protein
MPQLWNASNRIGWLGAIAASLLWSGAASVHAQDAVPVQPAADEPVVAQKQVQQQLQQRLVGLVPNYFVVYTPNPVPLSSRQKFQLALRSAVDPVTIAGAAGSGAWDQLENDPSNFGQGAAAYGMRVGTEYGESVLGTLTGRAVFPSLFKQDPRYFYKGTGSVRTRFFYAVSNSFICMGDNGRRQANVSEAMGSLVTATATEFKYPPNDRFGVGRIAENFAVNEAWYGAWNVFNEFFSRGLTFPWKHRSPAP